MKANICLLFFTGLAFSAAAVAQQPLDTENLDPETHAAECRAVNWHRDLLAAYPRAAEACHEVVVSETGERWTRFETQLVTVNNDGSVRSNFRDRDGNNMGAITIMPDRDMRVSIDGRDYRFAELRPGQILNVYVPDGAYGFAFAPYTPVAQRVRVVEIQPEPYVAPRRTVATRYLPSTAGPLPLLAIGGAMALLGGLGFTARRRNSNRGE